MDLIENWKNIIEKYQEIQEVYNEKSKNKSISFNFFKFKFFYVGEPQHSYLLQLLLDPKGLHGQGNLFLRKFLSMYEIENPEHGTWQVTAEQGRIDVLIKRNDPLSVIIIENKSHNAVDQKHQLYRYWIQEIVRPLMSKRNLDYQSAKEIINLNPVNFKILYLSTNKSKIPSENSLKRPEGEEWTNYDEILPMAYTHLTFNNEIVNWLEICKKQLSNENHRLREYLEQYIEICKNIN